MPFPIINLTPEAQAKVDHLTGVMESAKTSIDAIMADHASYKSHPASAGERKPGSHPELNPVPDTATEPEPFFDPLPRGNVRLFQTNPMKTLKQRLDSMCALTYQAKVFKADEGMVVVMAVGEYPVCIAADMDEAKAIIDALAAHAEED